MEKPWYRQLWPWLLIAPPLASVIGGFAILWVAIVSNDGLITQQPAGYARGRAECPAKDRACLNAPAKEEVR